VGNNLSPDQARHCLPLYPLTGCLATLNHKESQVAILKTIGNLRVQLFANDQKKREVLAKPFKTPLN